MFRGKFLDALREAFEEEKLRFPGQMKPFAEAKQFARLLQLSCRHKWVVYAKRPFGGPEQVLQYLGNYTHRIAISNRRLVSLQEGSVSFRWRDSAHKNKKRVMTLPVEEFLRRSFFTCYHQGSSASGTLDFWPTGNAKRWCRSAVNCWQRSQPSQAFPPRQLHPQLSISGNVRHAAGRW